MLFPKMQPKLYYQKSKLNNYNIPNIYQANLHHKANKSESKRKDLDNKSDKIILSKSLAFSISSPIDTIRQNVLTKNKISPKKILCSIPHAFIASFLIALPCHATINFFENMIDNEIISITFGVLIANSIKIPILYNYKRIQTGIKILNKSKQSQNIKKVIKISMCEDIIEETIKYKFSKQKLTLDENKNNESIVTNDFMQSFILFSLVYPFDILKNKGLYNIKNIKPSKYDFFMKASHKNIQNLLLFQILRNLK